MPGLTIDGRKRSLLAVIAREQHYATCLQFGLVRFVTPLAERADLIAPSDHQLLFQNIEEVRIRTTTSLAKTRVLRRNSWIQNPRKQIFRL